MRNQQYFSNFATTLIQQLHIPEGVDNSKSGAQGIYEQFGEEIRAKLEKMNPETLGRIASFGLPYNNNVTKGRTAMYLVHCGSYLGKYRSGRELLVELAVTAVIAEIYDTLRRQLRVERIGSSVS
ncbi:MAG: hypothetical protein NUV54_03555 [Candidatus Taylorbacteria bacterium]|nr:hypothetical protein [Candidatus Taylorbacteria bacterium]